MLLTRVLRRALLTLFILIGVTVIAFVLVRLAPGDPAKQMLPATATEEEVQTMRVRMGLDQPYVVQYFMYLGNLSHGDLGYSFRYKMANDELIFPRLLRTAEISAIGIVLALLISIPLGLIAGIKRGSLIDTMAMGFALYGQAMSPVWFCLFLILIFSVWLKWLPTEGTGTIEHLVMPSICIAFAFCSLVTRMLRTEMIKVLNEDYITATRARGVKKFQIYTRYAFKNAMLPIITVSGIQVGALLTGSVIIEQIFSWPGIGQLTYVAITSRDFQLLQSIMLIIALIMVLCNLTVDLLYPLVDKRIKFN